MYTWMYVCLYAWMHVCVYVWMYVPAYEEPHTCFSSLSLYIDFIHTYTYVYMYIYVYVYTYTYIHINMHDLYFLNICVYDFLKISECNNLYHKVINSLVQAESKNLRFFDLVPTESPWFHGDI